MSQAPAAPRPDHEFDAYARDYDAALARGLSATGEDKDYFARARVEWVARRLRELRHGAVRAVLDFGCGTGSATPWIRAALAPARVHGVDVSARSLDEARARYGTADVTFAPLSASAPDGGFDLAFCNGVFHHIPVDERLEAARWVRRALEPSGWFALWENNPWNPGTRYVMSRVSFDRDAITLTPPETRRLLREAGFAVVRTDFLFVFPRALSALRALEPRLSALPLGGQYLVLARA
jgi:SAM-dependent methyltransferase